MITKIISKITKTIIKTIKYAMVTINSHMSDVLISAKYPRIKKIPNKIIGNIMKSHEINTLLPMNRRNIPSIIIITGILKTKAINKIFVKIFRNSSLFNNISSSVFLLLLIISIDFSYDH